jgi:transcription elongation factor B subunit 1
MPNKSTVKLISAEGFEFVIDYKAACVSNTIRNMLSSQGARVGARSLAGDALSTPV